MKKIIVNYTQHWDNEGTHFDQVIKLDKKFIKYVNKLINYYHNSNNEVKEITCNIIGFSKYYDFYLKPIDIKNKVCFLNLTQLRFINYYLILNNFDTYKIKNRNTMLEII